MSICPKCNKEYSEAPGVSRIDRSPICRRCSEKEAVEAAAQAGAITKAQAVEILEALHE